MSEDFDATPSGLYLPKGAGAEAAPDLEAHRERPYMSFGALGPWGGMVCVTRVTKRKAKAGLMQNVVYEVTAVWTGPPMAGTGYEDYAADGCPLPTVAANDVWWTQTATRQDGELAEEVARRAADELRAARVPNLPEIAAAVRRRAA